jgi:hypothetical protein
MKSRLVILKDVDTGKRLEFTRIMQPNQSMILPVIWVLSTFFCEFLIGQFFEKRLVIMYFSYGI